MKVFIAGGTGLIGTRLVRALHQRKDHVVVLSRRPAEARGRFGFAASVVEGDPTLPGPWMEALDDCDAIINLAGENLFAKRWNDAFKQVIRDSRIKAVENLGKAIARRPRRADNSPKVLINGSATGYYGPHGDEELDENSPPGNDFLSQTCKDWEQAIVQAGASGVRSAWIRTGVVLDREGGALAKLLGPFRLYLGGPVGSGKQYLSWIHHVDLLNLIVFLLDQPTQQGPFNGTAPNPVTNREFSTTLGQVMGRPSFLATPEFALKLALGEVADVVLNGQRVLPRKALAAGFTFRYPTLEPALRDLLAEPTPAPSA